MPDTSAASEAAKSSATAAPRAHADNEVEAGASSGMTAGDRAGTRRGAIVGPGAVSPPGTDPEPGAAARVSAEPSATREAAGLRSDAGASVGSRAEPLAGSLDRVLSRGIDAARQTRDAPAAGGGAPGPATPTGLLSRLARADVPTPARDIRPPADGAPSASPEIEAVARPSTFASGEFPYDAGDFVARRAPHEPSPATHEPSPGTMPRAPDVHIGQITVVSPPVSTPAAPDPLASLADRRQGRSRRGDAW
ncbi:hypothetical protein ACGFSB_32885 [Streptomyces sp. NPDC048441]|uniref:hypothetical protein n=1 Tax=Streptomyces sp. NPDC048441 TaxID=3365552 RepID=UPI0037235A4C